MSALYDTGKKKLFDADIDLLVDNIKAVLVDTGAYTVNLATHEFLSSIAAGARIATTGNLLNKTTAAGVFRADPITISSVSGASVEAIAVYKDTGTDTTSPLIGWIDSVTGLPFTPNGSNVTITWDTGANGIFKI